MKNGSAYAEEFFDGVCRFTLVKNEYPSYRVMLDHEYESFENRPVVDFISPQANVRFLSNQRMLVIIHSLFFSFILEIFGWTQHFLRITIIIFLLSKKINTYRKFIKFYAI